MSQKHDTKMIPKKGQKCPFCFFIYDILCNRWRKKRMPAIDEIDKFYHSNTWKKARRAIVLKYRGLCCKCGKTGTEVHHIKPLTLLNVNDPMISINEDNLMLLCKSCHDAIRNDGVIRNDLEFDADGCVIPKGTPH